MRVPSIASAPPVAVRVVCALLVLVALSRCTNGTGPPVGAPGTVTYRLVSPNGVEGALLARAPVAQVTGVPEDDDPIAVLFTTVDEQVHIAVVHLFGTDDLRFELDVADTADPPELTLVEVAGPDDALRSLTGYALEIVP